MIMKNSSRFIAALSLVAALQSASAADIIGTVTLKGAPPPEREVRFPAGDTTCAKMHEKPLFTRIFMAGEKGELADTFVSLKGITGKSNGPKEKPALLDQVACEYTPYVMGVQTGQKLLVRNSDPFLHNVHPTPTNRVSSAAGPGNREQNLAQLAKAPDLEFTYFQPENFLRFKCDVHPWMFAYVNVVDHPWFDVTNEKGTFKISNVPPGKYTIEANHRRGGIVTKEVEVKDSDVTVDFVIELK
jgi:hypothetical protein